MPQLQTMHREDLLHLLAAMDKWDRPATIDWDNQTVRVTSEWQYPDSVGVQKFRQGEPHKDIHYQLSNLSESVKDNA